MDRKDVFITGAAGGLGQAMCQHLPEAGFRVFATDLEVDRIPATESIIPLVMDVSDRESVARAMRQVHQRTDGLDALVNNAGLFDQFPLAEGQSDRFERLLQVNVLGIQRVTETAFPLLLARKGRVVNISSESAMALMPMQTYALSKRMLEVFSEVLRQELRLLDMHVTVIRPGAHRTPFLEKSRKALDRVPEDSAFRRALEIIRSEGQAVMDRMTHHHPAEVARAVHRALTDDPPRALYPVHVSPTFQLLSRIPRPIREYLLRRKLR
jgi:NAD(P)-dependent dehydrogenase (short-subunit alcohol dehydrogenase family)